MEAILNTQLAVWERKSIVQRCLTVGYSTWKVSEDTHSLNTVQLCRCCRVENHKSEKSALSGMMSGMTFVFIHTSMHCTRNHLMRFIRKEVNKTAKSYLLLCHNLKWQLKGFITISTAVETQVPILSQEVML